MKYYVILDTNVIVSALLDEDNDSNTSKVLELLFDKKIDVLYSKEILAEYKDVLERKEFKFSKSKIGTIINLITHKGIEVTPNKIEELLVDKDDMPFYEIVMDTRDIDSKLITGNKKHFPNKVFIMTPAEFIKIFSI